MGNNAHYAWAASSTSRYLTCPGAFALCENLSDETSAAAREGICAHFVAEHCLKTGAKPSEYIGKTVDIGDEKSPIEVTVTQEMVEGVAVYVDYVRDKVGIGAEMMVEKKMSLNSLNPPFSSGGTADALLWYPGNQTLEVVDFKYGAGVTVDVKNNAQLRMYALCAMLTVNSSTVDRVIVTIAQPRGALASTPIRSESFDSLELLAWSWELMAVMRKAKNAQETLVRARELETGMDTWARTYLNPGEGCHSTFCKARGFCPALRDKVLNDARVHFDDLGNLRFDELGDVSVGQAAKMLDAFSALTAWMTAFKAHWLDQATKGVEVPGYCLNETQGLLTWGTDEDKDALEKAKAIISDVASANRVPLTDFYTPAELKTPKQVAARIKKLYKKREEAFNEIEAKLLAYASRRKTGVALVKAETATRPVASNAERYFDAI